MLTIVIFSKIDSINECIIEFEIKETLSNRVSLYLEFDNYYANHKDYVKSRDYPQMRNASSYKNYTTCDGAKYIKEIFDYDESKYYSFGQLVFDKTLNKSTLVREKLDGNSIAIPCGLQAKTFFNDSISIFFNNENIPINDTDITNEFDRKLVFNPPDDAWKYHWIDIRRERFIVWMQMESGSNFRKMWGRINRDLLPGKYILKVLSCKTFIFFKNYLF